MQLIPYEFELQHFHKQNQNNFMIETNLYTVDQIRQLEKLAIANGISEDQLMQRAGSGAFTTLQTHWPNARQIAILCGSGNNGGDGYVLAKLASKKGYYVKLRYVGELCKLSKVAFSAMEECRKIGLEIKEFNSTERLMTDVFVDALLGIGINGVVRNNIAAAINYLNEQSNNPLLSLDVPSGLHADYSSALGPVVYATVTATFIGIKSGLLTGDSKDYCGTLVLCDLDLPDEVFLQLDNYLSSINYDSSPMLPKRNRNAYKNQFGHVLIVGGNIGMCGAPSLAALAALRVGAGLVTIATHPKHAKLINANNLEIMVYAVDKIKRLSALLQKADVVVIGPGLGQDRWAKKMFAAVMKTNLPLIIDADALNLLAEFPKRRDNSVFTPHVGEAARLLKRDKKDIQQNRIKAVKDIQKKFGGICLLKGAGTLITDGKNIAICTDGNPGMASGGMGDLLAGVIAALIAQGMDLFSAAKYSVCLHAKAGDVAAQKGERGMLASDLLSYLRHLVNCKG